MSEIRKKKRDLSKLLGRLLGKRLSKEDLHEAVLNKQYKPYQLLETIAEMSNTKLNASVQRGLKNLRKRGLSEALDEFTEITQIGTYLFELLPQKETKTTPEQDYDESDYF